MDLTSIIMWIIVGGIGGWLASFFVKIPIGGIFGNIIVGIVGALLAGWLAGLIGLSFQVSGLNCGSVIVAFVGALILASIVGLLTRGRA